MNRLPQKGTACSCRRCHTLIIPECQYASGMLCPEAEFPLHYSTSIGTLFSSCLDFSPVLRFAVSRSFLLLLACIISRLRTDSPLPTLRPATIPTPFLSTGALFNCLLLSLEGFGRERIHEGTGQPDAWTMFAILSRGKGAIKIRIDQLGVGESTHALRYGASASVKYVMASPSRPARPVRPEIAL
jgi:hypothetical protein